MIYLVLGVSVLGSLLVDNVEKDGSNRFVDKIRCYVVLSGGGSRNTRRLSYILSPDLLPTLSVGSDEIQDMSSLVYRSSRR